jgi:hypothetical protein
MYDAQDHALWQDLMGWICLQPGFNEIACKSEEQIGLAVRIADSLLVEACWIDHSKRRLRLFKPEYARGTKFESLVLQTITTGVMYVDDFITRSLAAIDPSLSELTETSKNKRLLVVAKQGLVAYPLMLTTFSLSPNEAMAIVVQPGSLRWKDTQYTKLIEQRWYKSGGPSFSPLELFDSSGLPVPSIGLGEKSLCSLSHSISIEQDTLLLLTEIVGENRVNGSIEFRVFRFILAAIQRIATAYFAEALDLSQEGLAAELRSMPSHYSIFWSMLKTAHSTILTVFLGKDTTRLVSTTFRGILTDTGTSAVDCLSVGRCFYSAPLVIQRSASLLECVIQAHRMLRTDDNDHPSYIRLQKRGN